MVLITSIKHNMMTGTYTVQKAQRVPILTKKLTPKERIFIETAAIKIYDGCYVTYMKGEQ